MQLFNIQLTTKNNHQYESLNLAGNAVGIDKTKSSTDSWKRVIKVNETCGNKNFIL